jgi:hypothetical protein
MPVFDKFRLFILHNGFYIICLNYAKAYGLILFLFNPSGDDKLNFYKFEWPYIDFNKIHALLFVILIETKDSYFNFKDGIRLAIFNAL